jgi:glucose-6-phosphate 1-dehydrogenase
VRSEFDSRRPDKILRQLAASGLTVPCADDTGWTRILIEKPFGSDIQTARNLDKLLGSLFKEEQIFRIDHYLAKEALQNIIAFRFANSMFEPLWNKDHISRVHIKLFEKDGVEGRGAFYDPLGALRDVGQNHMCMMLAIMTMNDPKEFTADAIRRERARILSKLKPLDLRMLRKTAVRGQYEGYRSDKAISPLSQTETYFRIEASIDTPRWNKVPFFLESGKALSETKTEIDVYFKNPKKGGEENILTFRIQPDEGIKVKFFVKVPGYSFAVEPKTLKFKYSDVASFALIPNDYERLIHDAFTGDQTLFASTAEIIASWKFVTPILENWSKLPLVPYEKGATQI